MPNTMRIRPHNPRGERLNKRPSCQRVLSSQAMRRIWMPRQTRCNQVAASRGRAQPTSGHKESGHCLPALSLETAAHPLLLCFQQ